MTTKITKTALVTDLKRVARRLRTTPTRNQYRSLGKFSSWLVEERFGSWTKAVASI